MAVGDGGRKKRSGEMRPTESMGGINRTIRAIELFLYLAAWPAIPFGALRSRAPHTKRARANTFQCTLAFEVQQRQLFGLE